MGNFSRDSFDPLKRYVSVRLQQGVPLIDADWNEMEDIGRFELRTILKWFIGNGIPEGSNAFRIIGSGLANNFTISAGAAGSDALNAGRCLVDGMSVFITSDFTFTNQPLHVSQAGSTALSAALGVPRIDMPTTFADTLVVYLDVWERLVTRAEDPNLVLPSLGIESCVRLKREAVVRVRNGTSLPSPGNPDFLSNHSYYALANITRRNGDPLINVADVSDRRQTRLTLSALEGRLRLIEQVFLIPAFRSSPNQFTPKLGAPGTQVTLSGNNFNVSPPIVRFGNTPATIVGTPTNTQIVAVVPTLAPGNVQISVQTIGGTVVSNDTFTVPTPPTFAPSPNQFTPKSGAPGTQIRLFGNNLNLGSPLVRFGGTTASIIGTPTATEILVAVPPISPSSVQISIQTSGGTVTSTDVFSVSSPPGGLPPEFDRYDPGDAIFQFEPGSGSPGIVVNLYGSNFNVGTPTVSFGTVTATIAEPATSSGVTVRVPNMPPGNYRITVATSVGSTISAQIFSVIADDIVLSAIAQQSLPE